jgi:hypothetical protein
MALLNAILNGFIDLMGVCVFATIDLNNPIFL